MKANIIAVFDKEKEKVLVCRRRKNPYKGLLNFVGGKIEKEEDGLTAAYRELWEETGITDADIELTHLMDFNYLVFDNWLEVYFGRLNKDFTVRGEENELLWIDISSDF
ncbi:NUDIX hydrolase, partial [Eisenbergiella massiliensis]